MIACIKGPHHPLSPNFGGGPAALPGSFILTLFFDTQKGFQKALTHHLSDPFLASKMGPKVVKNR